jgi:ribosomal protein S18 acetylase RimI-like enzyme
MIPMNIVYNGEKKNLPFEQLHKIFIAVGWSDDAEMSDEMRAGFMQPWHNSTLVVSAWNGDKLVGAVRVLSDTIFRSIIYDLLVLPEFQNKGIGTELVRRCIEHFPNSEWLVETAQDISGYYEKIGFKRDNSDIFLKIPCRLFTNIQETRRLKDEQTDKRTIQ